MRNSLVWNKPEEEKHRDNRGEKKEIEITERAFVRKCGALFCIMTSQSASKMKTLASAYNHGMSRKVKVLLGLLKAIHINGMLG